MNIDFLTILKCACCGNDLELRSIAERKESEILWGILYCNSCTNKFPIAHGIPIMKFFTDSVDIRKNKMLDNLKADGIEIKDIIFHIESGETEKASKMLLASPMPRTGFRKQKNTAKPVKNSITKILPNSISKRINWNIFYFFKGLFKTLTFEDFRMKMKERKVYDQMKSEKKASNFIKLYFDHIKVPELYHYFTNRFTTPRYLVALSFASMIPKNNKPILDLACGVGHVIHFLTQARKNQVCVGIDRDFVSLYVGKTYLAPKGEFIYMDADMPLPFRDESFAGVLCADAFQFFKNRLASVRDMKRIISKKGSIIISGVLNPLSKKYTLKGPDQISPLDFKQLFNGIDSVILGEKKVMNAYLNKSGPDLSSEDDLDVLKDQLRLSVVASYDKSVFQEINRFEQWPHSFGKLELSPLYQYSGKDADGNHKYKFEFPSKWYEFENKDWLDFADEEIVLNESEINSIEKGEESKTLDDLIDRFIVLGIPRNYF